MSRSNYDFSDRTERVRETAQYTQNQYEQKTGSGHPSIIVAANKESEVASDVFSGYTQTDEATVIHPMKADDGSWIANDNPDTHGALAVLDERHVSADEKPQLVAQELQEEYDELFDEAPESARVYIKGEGNEAKIGVGIHDPDGDTAELLNDTVEGVSMYESATLDKIKPQSTSQPQESFTNHQEEWMTAIKQDVEEPRVQAVNDESFDERMDKIADGQQVFIDKDKSMASDTAEEADSIGEVFGRDTRRPLVRGALVQFSDDVYINIRSGDGLPAKLPRKEGRTPEQWVAKLMDAYGKEDKEGYKTRIIEKDEDYEFSNYVSDLVESISDEDAEKLADELDPSEMTEQHVSDVAEHIEDNEAATEATRKAKLLSEYKESKTQLDLPVVGIGGSLHRKLVRCGKNCNGCPHGPYLYKVYRDGNGYVVTEYADNKSALK